MSEENVRQTTVPCNETIDAITIRVTRLTTAPAWQRIPNCLRRLSTGSASTERLGTVHAIGA